MIGILFRIFKFLFKLTIKLLILFYPLIIISLQFMAGIAFASRPSLENAGLLAALTLIGLVLTGGRKIYRVFVMGILFFAVTAVVHKFFYYNIMENNIVALVPAIAAAALVYKASKTVPVIQPGLPQISIEEGKEISVSAHGLLGKRWIAASTLKIIGSGSEDLRSAHISALHSHTGCTFIYWLRIGRQPSARLTILAEGRTRKEAVERLMRAARTVKAGFTLSYNMVRVELDKVKLPKGRFHVVRGLPKLSKKSIMAQLSDSARQSGVSGDIIVVFRPASGGIAYKLRFRELQSKLQEKDLEDRSDYTRRQVYFTSKYVRKRDAARKHEIEVLEDEFEMLLRGEATGLFTVQVYVGGDALARLYRASYSGVGDGDVPRKVRLEHGEFRLGGKGELWAAWELAEVVDLPIIKFEKDVKEAWDEAMASRPSGDLYIGMAVDPSFNLYRPAYLNSSDLTTHMAIIAATGGGKTVLAEVIVEELAKRGVKVLILDIVGEYEGLLRPNDNREMLSLYKTFGMDKPRGFNVKVYIPGVNLFPVLAIIPSSRNPEVLGFAIESAVKKIAKYARLTPDEQDTLKLALYESLSSREVTGALTLVDIERCLEHVQANPPKGFTEKSLLKMITKLELLMRMHPDYFSNMYSSIEDILDYSGGRFASKDPVLVALRFAQSEERSLEASLFILESVYFMAYEKLDFTDKLRLLIVVDEAHRYMDNKDIANRLIKIIKELRKFGVGVLLVTQNVTDFTASGRASIQKNINNWAIGRIKYTASGTASRLLNTSAGEICKGFPAKQGYFCIRDARGNFQVVKVRPTYSKKGKIPYHEIKRHLAEKIVRTTSEPTHVEAGKHEEHEEEYEKQDLPDLYSVISEISI